MSKTRIVDVIAADICDQWQVIISLPEVQVMIPYTPTEARQVADGLDQGVPFRKTALVIHHEVAPDLFPAIAKELRKMARLAEYSQQQLEMDADCGCVLPEHSCQVCRAAARKASAWNGEDIPFC